MLDVSEELTSTTGCRGRDLNRRPLSLWASTLQNYIANNDKCFVVCLLFLLCIFALYLTGLSSMMLI